MASPGTAPDSERRSVTVLLCDIVGSTELSGRLDPEDLRELLESRYRAWRAVIERYEGFVARHMGDGLLAYFGYPVGHEDDAERAAHAALEISQQASQPPVGPAGPGPEVAVRVGIATGLVVVGGLIGKGASEESPAFGMTPNLAARLQALAVPNSVAISDSTWRLIPNPADHFLAGWAGHQ